MFLLAILGILMVISSVVYMGIIATLKTQNIRYEWHEMIFTLMGMIGLILAFCGAFFTKW